MENQLTRVEQMYIRRIREHFPRRHEVATTTDGQAIKCSLYWVKDSIKELRSYRAWLEWLCQQPDGHKYIAALYNQPEQVTLFSVEYGLARRENKAFYE